MTTITHFQNNFRDSFTDWLWVETLVSASATEVTYINRSNQFVSVIGHDIEFNMDDGFTSGFITELSVSTTDGEATDLNLLLTDIRQNAEDIFGTPREGVMFDANVAWNTILDGDVVANSLGTSLSIGYDGADAIGGGVVFGGDLSATYLAQNFGATVIGGVRLVAEDTTYVSGTVNFIGNASGLSANASSVDDTSTLIGGDDILVYQGPNGQPFDAGSTNWSGDAGSAAGDSTIVGGDDLMDLRALTTFGEFISINGDAFLSTRNSTNSIIYGGDDTIYGSLVDDNRITGDAAIFGGAPDVQNDSRVFGGDDLIFAGAGDDTIYGDQLDEIMPQIAGGDDTIYSGNGSDTIYGNAGRDLIFDAFGPGEIYGGSGDDRFTPTANGNHAFYGGDGQDRIDYMNSTAGVSVNLETETLSGGFANGDLIDSVEEVRGSSAGDTLVGAENEDNTLVGKGGNDTIEGGTGNNVLYGSNGNDRVFASDLGSEILFGGNGNDTLDLSKGSVGVTVYLDNNFVAGGMLSDDVISNFENVKGTSGADTLRGDNGANKMAGGDGDDFLRGLDGADRLSGSLGEDSISAGNGADQLFGGHDDDILLSGQGRDTMTGGNGADEFHYYKGHDRDRITDFENNVDTIVFRNLGNNPLDLAEQRGSDVVINFGSGDVLRIENVTINQLSDDVDFI